MIHIKHKISICYFYYLIFFFNFFPSCVVMTALSDARRSVFVAEKSKIIFISWQFYWQICNAFSWHRYIVNCVTRYDNDLIAGDDDVFARFSLWLNIGNDHNAHFIHEKCMVPIYNNAGVLYLCDRVWFIGLLQQILTWVPHCCTPTTFRIVRM